MGVTVWRWLVSLVLLCLGALLVLFITWAYFKMEVRAWVCVGMSMRCCWYFTSRG